MVTRTFQDREDPDLDRHLAHSLPSSRIPASRASVLAAVALPLSLISLTSRARTAYGSPSMASIASIASIASEAQRRACASGSLRFSQMPSPAPQVLDVVADRGERVVVGVLAGGHRDHHPADAGTVLARNGFRQLSPGCADLHVRLGLTCADYGGLRRFPPVYRAVAGLQYW